MTSIDELLARLRELDQETFDVLYDRWRALEDGGKSVVDGFAPGYIPGFGWFDIITLLGVLWDAIAAKGWDSEVYIYSDGEAEVSIYLSEDTSLKDCWGNTATEALLVAYIAALEATR